MTWQTNMGTADLKAFFGSRKHELNVSTYQMVILLLFNTSSQITFKELKETSGTSVPLSAKPQHAAPCLRHFSPGIPVPELKRNLMALCMAKYKVLSKEPKTKQVADEDTFAFNSAFKSKLYRVRILPLARGESKEERDATREKVDEERKHQIEAAIVRVMKARKTMEHSQLIAEVTQQLSARCAPSHTHTHLSVTSHTPSVLLTTFLVCYFRFMPNPMVVKKRIESLIEREYLERSKKDRKLYNYLA